LGGAFLHGFGAEGAWRTACYPEWDAKLEGAMSHRLQELVQARGRVFVVTVPYPLGRYDTAEYRTQVDCINASLRRAAQSAPASRVLEFQEHICPKGACLRELPGSGQLRPDGVHFSMDGAQYVAHWVFAQLDAQP
jgi:lysophospholipase L1-like esterase